MRVMKEKDDGCVVVLQKDFAFFNTCGGGTSRDEADTRRNTKKGKRDDRVFLDIVGGNLTLTLVDLTDDLGGGLAVDGATNRDAGSNDLLDGSGHLTGERALAENLGDVVDLSESDVSVVLSVLLLLAVAGRLLEGSDDHGGGGGDDLDGGLTVLNDQLDGDLQSLPVSSDLGNIISDLSGVETEGTELGGKGGRVTNLTTDATEANY